MKKLVLFMFITVAFSMLLPQPLLAAERNETLTNKEIIERLTRLEEGQKAILQRFEDINKRFEDINRQLDRITAVFTALVIAVIGFAYWDRRTIIRKAKEETISHLEREGRFSDLINAMRELAKIDPKVAEILKRFDLL
ncbi:MAG: hypothetical protein ACK415_02975 [Thermodesulfovibrionales bacterium]